MNILAELRQRFSQALLTIVSDTTQVSALAEMIRATQDAKFGDYQANCAMPLGKQLGQNPRDIASKLVELVDLSDWFHPPEVAGPGFINLKLRDDVIAQQLQRNLADERLGVAPVSRPRTFVIDFSSPNVAKAMHVGHIRSTVIGDALSRTLRFLGHRVISDNHLGDWGTQFGMIIYGYKHFVDQAAFAESPVKELNRLYKLVQQLVGYREHLVELPKLAQNLAEKQSQLSNFPAPPVGDKQAEKKAGQAKRKLEGQISELSEEIASMKAKLTAIESSPTIAQLAKEHVQIDSAVLAETAKLHAGDEENLRLWKQFLPDCRQDIQRLYQRLNVTFDYELGESFYHDRLASVVEDFERRGLARVSEGALCVFLEGFESPMIIRKKDGAFLYATTDLATIAYRMQQWQPDAILYVVDHRQGEHFEKLFAATRLWGFDHVELKHVSFGTVLGDDGKPYKTRSGDTVGLAGLLDEAAHRVRQVIAANRKEGDAALTPQEEEEVAETVGIAAIKYADLSQNRTSDYKFSYEKMVALEGNTATYMQYCFARRNGIYRRGNLSSDVVRSYRTSIQLADPAERALGAILLRFPEALHDVTLDYRPNMLAEYLYELGKAFATFFDKCKVLKAETTELKESRLQLCELSALTIQKGLELLGIQTTEKM
jgi:arginyl-tRNA synthetase